MDCAMCYTDLFELLTSCIETADCFPGANSRVKWLDSLVLPANSDHDHIDRRAIHSPSVAGPSTLTRLGCVVRLLKGLVI